MVPQGEVPATANCCQEPPSSTRLQPVPAGIPELLYDSYHMHAPSNKTPFKSGGWRGACKQKRGGQEAKPACKQKSVFRGNTKLFLEYKAPTHNNKQGPHLTKLYKEPSVVKDANVLPRQAWAETTVKTHQLHSY